MITIVVASSNNGVIGRGNGLPWRLPVDLKHFKKTTLGKPVIMGRRTLASLGDKPLPGRENVVVSTTSAPVAGTHLARTIDEAVEIAQRFNDEAMILGGGNIYAQTVSLADKIVLTVVLTDVVGDTHFPPLTSGWVEDVGSTHTHPADDKNTHAMVFLTLWREGNVPAGVETAPFSWPSAAFDARFLPV